MHYIIVLKTELQNVYMLRHRAEENMKMNGGGGMTFRETVDFVDHYMHVYKEYLQDFYDKYIGDKNALFLYL